VAFAGDGSVGRVAPLWAAGASMTAFFRTAMMSGGGQFVNEG
jgi:hypothetical protein